MPTLKEKKLISDAVTGETKRCLALLRELRQNIEHNFVTYEDIEDINDDINYIIKKVIKDSPYIKFHPELLKRIPK